MGRIVYFVCYAMMPSSLLCTTAALLDCLPDVCMHSERLNNSRK